jgi:L-amino acid N-acyltransferase YncA
MGHSIEFAGRAETAAWHRAVPGIGAVTVRPLSLADWNAYREFGNRIERNDMRLRFAGPVKLDDGRCRRFLDIDHDHEEALAAFDDDGAILGVARLARVSTTEADIGLIVRSDLKRRGVGSLLLDRLIRYAEVVGLDVLTGDVLYENRAMLSLARRAGFRFIGNAGVMVAIRLDLHAGPAPRLVPTRTSPGAAPQSAQWAPGASPGHV